MGVGLASGHVWMPEPTVPARLYYSLSVVPGSSPSASRSKMATAYGSAIVSIVLEVAAAENRSEHEVIRAGFLLLRCCRAEV